MKRLMTDRAVKETAKTNPVKARLRLLRPAFVQFHSIGVASISLCDLPQGFTASAAWVQQVGNDSVGKPYAPQDQRDVFRVGGIIAHTDMIHQPPHCRRVRCPINRKSLCKSSDRIVNRPVDIAHQVKT